MRLPGSESQKPRERFALPANARTLPDVQSKRPLPEATQGKLSAAAPGAAGSSSAHRARPSGGRHCGTPAYAAARQDGESPAPELGQCGPHTPGPQHPLALPVSGRSPRDLQLQMLVGCGRHRAPSSTSLHPQCTRCHHGAGATAPQVRWPRSLGLVPPPPGSTSRESTGAGGGQTSEPAGICEVRLR